jgi:hypothetical protein
VSRQMLRILVIPLEYDSRRHPPLLYRNVYTT